MKRVAEWAYWAIVALIMTMAVGYGAVAGWEQFVGPFEHGLLDTVFVDPAIWLFPSSLMSGWMLLFLTFPDLVRSEIMVVMILSVHVLLTMALAAWFYCSRRASLRLRGAVLAGLLVLGVAPLKLAELFLF